MDPVSLDTSSDRSQPLCALEGLFQNPLVVVDVIGAPWFNSRSTRVFMDGCVSELISLVLVLGLSVGRLVVYAGF